MAICATKRLSCRSASARSFLIRGQPAFGGEITYVTRGRGHHCAAAIVPAELVERYEEMIDRQDGRVAAERTG
jgi:hypothetical protein